MANLAFELLYFLRRIGAAKFSIYTWPLLALFGLFAVNALLNGQDATKFGALDTFTLVLANIAFWGDVVRDIRRRGYRLSAH